METTEKEFVEAVNSLLKDKEIRELFDKFFGGK